MNIIIDIIHYLLFTVFFLLAFSNRRIKALFIVVVEKCSMKMLLAAAIIVTALSFWVGVNYVGTPGLYEPVESHFENVSWYFMQGHPLYHAIDSAERYSMLYGPMTYIIVGCFLKTFGPSFWAAKLSAFVSASLTFLAFWLLFRKLIGSKASFIYSSFIWVVICSFYSYLPYVMRADTFIVLIVSLALLAVNGSTSLIATMIVSLSLGICINLKLHSIAYFVPIYILLFQRFGLKYALLTIPFVIFAAAAPFAFFREISVVNYAAWLKMASRHPLSSWSFFDAADRFLLILSPIIAVFLFNDSAPVFSANKLFAFGTFASIALILVIASKVGAGSHHLQPFIPSIAYLALMIFRRFNYDKTHIVRMFASKVRMSVVMSFLVIIIVFFVNNHIVMFQNKVKYGGAYEFEKDVEKIIMMYPNSSIGLGYGNGPFDWGGHSVSAALVFAGNPLLFEVAALMDMQESGIEIPSNTVERLNSCNPKIWLIAKDSEPFKVKNFFYEPHNELFSPAFQQAFYANYRHKAQSDYFDIWECLDNRRNSGDTIPNSPAILIKPLRGY